MNITDPLSDMLTRIRNAHAAGHVTVGIPHSKMKAELARILKAEGYIRDYVTEGERVGRVIKVYLKYSVDKESAIRGLKRVSRPGLRRYVNFQDVPRVLGGMGIAVLSTSRGILTDREARKARVGGEVLCEVW